MKPTPYDQLWNDRSNWKWGLFYSCKDDPRIIVPKCPAWTGRTLNFAHREAYYLLVATIAVLTLPCTLIGSVPVHIFLVAFLPAILLVVVYYYFADPRHSC